MSARDNTKLEPPFFRKSYNILRQLLRISLASHIDIDIGFSQEACSTRSGLKLAEAEHILRKLHFSYQTGTWKITQNSYQLHTEKNLKIELKPAD